MQLADQTVRRVFIAEDDADILDLIRIRLGTSGYVVSYERDGAAALRTIAKSPPDAIILDVSMPEIDGFAVLQALKARRATADIPVMMLTARNAPDDVRRAIAMGAKDFLAKPFDQTQLVQRVGRLFLRAGRPPAPGTPASRR